MNVNVEELGGARKKMTVEIPAEQVRAALDQAVETLRRQARIKGFRPGKVPAGMIRRMFLPQIQQDVTQQLINDSLPEAMEQIEDTVVSQPDLVDSQFEEGQPFQYSVSFEVKPEFDVDGYMGLDLEREQFEVTDEMVDGRLEELRQAFASTRSLEEDRPVAEGDLAVVDYQALVDDQPLEGGANPNYQIEIGSGRFHEDVEKGLIGAFKGDEKEMTVPFADDHYNPKLAGQLVTFKIEVKDIKEKVLPDLDDAFAQDLGQEGIDTFDKLKERVRADMIEAEESRVRRQLEDNTRAELVKLVDFEAPDSLIGQELESMISNTEYNLKRSGLTLEAIGTSEAKLREDLRPEAEKKVKAALILEKIAQKHELEATEEDLEKQMAQVAEGTGQTPEAIREIYNKNNLVDSLKENLVRDKALNIVIEGANIKDVEPSPAQAESQED
jgi:trigger factor